MKKVLRRKQQMNEGDEAGHAQGDGCELEIHALLDRVAAAMIEIAEAKRERSTEDVRSARTQLAALHGVARLRRLAERDPRAA
jgi:hypothetical protein